jgi:hypothetical protein
MVTDDEDEAEEADEGDDVDEKVVEAGAFGGESEAVGGVVQDDVVLRENGLAQDHPVVEGLLYVQDQLLALRLVLQFSKGDVDVLSPEVEEQGLLQHLVQLLL